MTRKIIATACLAVLFSFAARYAFAGDGVTLWQTLPWLKEDPRAEPADRAMMPAGRALAQMADEEYEPLIIYVHNATDRHISFRVRADELVEQVKDEEGQPALSVEVFSSWVAPIRKLQPNSAAHRTLAGSGGDSPAPGDMGDPLIETPPSRVLHCPAGEGRSVWLVLKTSGARPGVYEAPVRLVSSLDDDDVLAKMDVTLEVWPFALPEKLDIACYHWDYGADPRALRMMREAKVNTFMIPALPHGLEIREDGTVAGSMAPHLVHLRRETIPWARFVGSYGFFAQFAEWADENDIEYMSDEYRELFAKTLRFMVAELKEAGLDYDDFIIQHIDEAHGPAVERVIEHGKMAREIDPELRLALTVMSTFEEVRRMAPYTDVIMFRGEAYWTKEQIEWYGRFQAEEGHEIWQFKQMGMHRHEPAVHQWNRLRSWRTWLNRWDGHATFHYSGSVYNPFADPISVRQWEAIREGNEDYQYFALVRDYAGQIADRDPERAESALKLVDDLVQGLIGPTAPGTGMLYTPEDPIIMLYPYQVRAKMASEIAELMRLAGEDVEPAEPFEYQPPWLLTERPDTPDAPSLIDFPEPVDLSSPSTYEPQSWNSEPFDLEGASRYQLIFRYRAWGTLQSALTLRSEETARDRRGNEIPARILFQSSLPDTDGERRWFSTLVEVDARDRCLITLLSSGQRAPDEEGNPLPARMEISDLDIRFADHEPLMRKARGLERHLAGLRRLTGEFDHRNDPLLRTIAAVEPEFERLKARVENVDAGDAARLAGELDTLSERLNAKPFAVWSEWLGDDYRALPPSSEMAVGRGGLPPPMPGLPAQRPQALPGASSIFGVANFTDAPLSFLVVPKRGREITWRTGWVDAEKGRGPLESRGHSDFVRRRGWAEFVVPAGETRYLVTEGEGVLELQSTDRRFPDMELKVGKE